MITELQSVKLNCLNDNQTQTCKNETDELTFLTCATLEEIMKELKRKGCLDGMNEEELMVAACGLGNVDNECCNEMSRLQEELDMTKKQLESVANCEELCKDALQRLKELETENSRLAEENKLLTDKIEDGEAKLANMLKKVDDLDNELKKSRLEAQKIGKDLEGTKDLVKDISDIQFKNQQMANAVSAINSRDDQKIIDDLRRQLEEEFAKLKKCQEDNAKLIVEAEHLNKELSQLGDLNNKLEAEKAQLIAENQNLIADLDKLTKKQQQDKHLRNGQSTLKAKDTDESKPTNNTISKTVNKPDEEHKDKDLDKEKEKDKAKKEDQDKNKDPYQYQDKDKEKAKDQDQDIDIYEDQYKAIDKYQDRNKDKKEKYQAIDKEKDQDHKDKLKIKYDNKITPVRTENENVSKPTDKVENLFETVKDKTPTVALDDFVKKKTDSFQFKLQQGRGFEKEFRNILEEFIRECGFCFCRLFNPKSRLYIICHKLYNCGLNTLSFRELAYLHKRIYARAEQLVPGCLLDMILSDNKDKVGDMLCTMMPRFGGGGTELDYKLSYANVMDIDPKCCCCKNELCCNNSDEMLKDKGKKGISIIYKLIIIIKTYIFVISK